MGEARNGWVGTAGRHSVHEQLRLPGHTRAKASSHVHGLWTLLSKKAETCISVRTRAQTPPRHGHLCKTLPSDVESGRRTSGDRVQAPCAPRMPAGGPLPTAPAKPNRSVRPTQGWLAFWSPASQWVLGQQCPAGALQLGGGQRVWRGIGAPDPGAKGRAWRLEPRYTVTAPRLPLRACLRALANKRPKGPRKAKAGGGWGGGSPRTEASVHPSPVSVRR